MDDKRCPTFHCLVQHDQRSEGQNVGYCMSLRMIMSHGCIYFVRSRAKSSLLGVFLMTKAVKALSSHHFKNEKLSMIALLHWLWEKMCSFLSLRKRKSWGDLSAEFLYLGKVHLARIKIDFVLNRWIFMACRLEIFDIYLSLYYLILIFQGSWKLMCYNLRGYYTSN